jgi:hypothetical protein
MRKIAIVDCLKGVVPPLLMLAWLALTSHSEEVVGIARMAMFLPVAWLTLRLGWQGAAIGGLLASVAVELTLTVERDPAVMQAEALIAFAVSSLILLGARMATKPVGDSAGSEAGSESQRGFLLAQQGLYQEELRLRHVAESLDRLGQSMRDGQHRMMERLRPVLPASMENTYARHLDLTQMEMRRLADALHPRAWREHGLAATFESGPLSKAASLVGAAYRCTLTGTGLNLLAPDVHMMLYRQACEVLVYMLAREPMKRIRVHIRGGSSHGRRWVVLRMTAVRSAPALRGKPVPEWRQLVARHQRAGHEHGARTRADLRRCSARARERTAPGRHLAVARRAARRRAGNVADGTSRFGLSAVVPNACLGERTLCATVTPGCIAPSVCRA